MIIAITHGVTLRPHQHRKMRQNEFFSQNRTARGSCNKQLSSTIPH